MAQSAASAPDMLFDAQTLHVQNQAEEVYERGDFDRAYFIYRNELAPIGDKFGQYVVGYMHLTGQGVAENAVVASAWYRLAAERGTKEFVRVRDELLAALNDQQRAESDRLFIELRKQYGDLVLVARAVREDYESLKARTGTHLGSSGASPLTVIELDSGVMQSGAEYYGRIERRMKARLDYIARHTDIEISDVDGENVDVNAIEEQVAARLNRLD